MILPTLFTHHPSHSNLVFSNHNASIVADLSNLMKLVAGSLRESMRRSKGVDAMLPTASTRTERAALVVGSHDDTVYFLIASRTIKVLPALEQLR